MDYTVLYSYNFSFTTSYMYIAILKHCLSQNISILQTVVLQISFKNILTKSSITSSDVGLHLYLIFEYPTYHGLTTYVHESLIPIELRNLFDIIHVFKCTAYCYRIIYLDIKVCHIHVLRHGD